MTTTVTIKRSKPTAQPPTTSRTHVEKQMKTLLGEQPHRVMQHTNGFGPVRFTAPSEEAARLLMHTLRQRCTDWEFEAEYVNEV